MDRVQILLAEITKAYKLAHRDVPKLDELRLEASIVSSDASNVPTAYLAQSYSHARVHGRSSVPTSKDVVLAWDNSVRQSVANASNAKAIEYKPRHACKFCAVVSLRLGVMLPDATEQEIRMSKEPITEDELQCVRATAEKDATVFRHWQESQQSPYKGVL